MLPRGRCLIVALGSQSQTLHLNNQKYKPSPCTRWPPAGFGEKFFENMAKAKTQSVPECAPLPAPSDAERAAIAVASTRVRQRNPRLTVRLRQNGGGKVEIIGGEHNDQTGWLLRLEDTFGTRGTAFAISQINRLMAASRDSDGKIDTGKLNGLLALIEGAAPTNEVQAALAVQMALTHHAAQTLLMRSLSADQIPQFDSASNSAVKLLRTFAMQVEVLAKLQRGGEQVVKVVHVHPGAQAIVGNVVSGQNGPRGGVDDERGSQPHAKAELPAPRVEPMHQMWSADTKRPCVPLAVCEG